MAPNNFRFHRHVLRAVARALIGGGGCIFIYSGSDRLVSFEIKLISKEVSRVEPEYMNMHPPPPNYRSSDGPACTLSTSLKEVFVSRWLLYTEFMRGHHT